MKKLLRVLRQPSFYQRYNQDLERKNKYRRLFDLIIHYLKYGKINTYYNKYGLDIKNLYKQKDYFDATRVWCEIGRNMKGRLKFPYTKMVKVKKAKNTYAAITFDKYLFSLVMRSKHGNITPNIYGVYSNGNPVLPYDNSKSIKKILESLKNNEKVVFKLINSLQGKGFILVEKKREGYIYNYGTISDEEFWLNINNHTYIVQEYIEQHEDMKKINPYAVSTIRIVTFRTTKGIEVFSCAMRSGTKNNAAVDNLASGGLIVGVDEEKGCLKEIAHLKNGGLTNKHPITNIIFKGYKIPYLKESVELCKKCHNDFKDVSTIGWDVAITKDGPILIEANSDWDIPMMQLANGGLKSKWNELMDRLKY